MNRPTKLLFMHVLSLGRTYVLYSRWPMVVFYDILDVSAVNAFILWTHINPTWNQNKLQRRRLFLKELGKGLVAEHLQTRLTLPNLSLSLRAIIEESIREMHTENDDNTESAVGTSQSDDNADRRHGEEDDFQVPRASLKRGRCTLCDRKRDKKVRITCHQCHSFVCVDHSKVVCNNC
jgi:hypothetical protein